MVARVSTGMGDALAIVTASRSKNRGAADDGSLRRDRPSMPRVGDRTAVGFLRFTTRPIQSLDLHRHPQPTLCNVRIAGLNPAQQLDHIG